MSVKESGYNKRRDAQYIDGKILRWMLSSLNLQSLARHTLMTMGLSGVRDGAEGMNMSFLLKLAEEWMLDDVFVEWAEQYTPYKYSTKKKRLVQKNGGKWDLDSAFFNPLYADEDLLEEEIKKLKRTHGISQASSVDIGDFLDHLNKEINNLDRLIEARIERNRRKGKRQLPSHPLMGQAETNNTETRQAKKQEKLLRKNNKSKKKKKHRSSNISAQKNKDVVQKNAPISLSPEEREKKKKIQEEQRIIRNYLSRNPLPDSVGPMGVPQSKFRYGTYGLNSMEYDSWRRS